MVKAMLKIKEKIKPKRPAVIHNLTKIKALLFLQMRQQTEKKFATAREIAIATGGNPDSLYVLLQRWAKWELVGFGVGENGLYKYRLAPEGERYLSKIPNWFFSGYYSKKRKKRVPGYKGKVEDLKREIAIASNAIFWFRVYSSQWERDKQTDKGVVWVIEAPFNSPGNLRNIEGSLGRAINTNIPGCLLTVKFDSCVNAYNFLPEWGFSKAKVHNLGQAIIDSKLGMKWSEDGT